jgi:hypothetical protein
MNNRVYPYIGGQSSPSAEGSGEAAPAEDRPLLAFCTRQGINEITSDDTDETIVASLTASGMTWKEDELEAEEIEMLTANGLEAVIEKKTAPKKLSRGAPAKGKRK